MILHNIFEAMKLQKRFIAILSILILGFICQTLYFYSSPSSNKFDIPDHVEEVFKTPIKSNKNKTVINTRNLFQGIKLHREIIKNKVTSTVVTTIDKATDFTKVEESDSQMTISFKVNTFQINSFNKNKLLEAHFKPVKRNNEDILQKNKKSSSAELESPKTRNARRKFTNNSYDSSLNINFGVTKSSKIVQNPTRKLKFSGNKTKLGNDGFYAKFDINKEAFAADSKFRVYGSAPLKKNLNKTEQSSNIMESTIKQPSEHDFRHASVKDHRIFGVDMNHLSRNEILFGTLKPRNISRLKDEIRIVSMSLYGAENHYMVGAIENAKLVKKNFVGWQLRFYVESPLVRSSRYGLVPQHILDALRNLGADIHYIVPEEDFLPPMMWRFLIADDPSVDRFIIRDSDSRLTKRDFAAVEAWMESGQAFQCTRDHPSHAGQSVSGGLWGGDSHKLRIILRSSWIEAMRGRSSNYFSDMDFLQGHIWTRVASHAYCSDSVSCDRWPNSFPFPVRRYGYDHVGEVYDERGIGRKVDIRILQRHGENERCLPPPEY